jgi:glycosyltransferase involved in cell wall biosynthesis
LDFPAAYFAALRLKNLRLIPYLFDDYVFQWFGWERKLAHGIASVLMKRASRVLVPNEFLAEAYRSRFGISTVIVRNPSEPFRAERGKEKPFLPRSGIRIVYTGAVYHAHYDALANVAKAVESMEDSEITLHIFSQQSKAMIEAHGIKGSRVFIHPHVDHAKIEQVFSEATILLLPLAFQSPIPEVIRTSAPGKMGEYLLSGKPILVHAPSDCFISWFFQHHQCGTVAPRNNVEDLKRSIREIGHDPEKTGRLLLKAQSVGQQEFSLEVNLNRFLTAISEK